MTYRLEADVARDLMTYRRVADVTRNLVTYRREADVTRNLVVVVVSLLDLRLAGGKVRANEAQRRAVEVEANRNRALVSGRAAQTRLNSLDRDVSTVNIHKFE